MYRYLLTLNLLQVENTVTKSWLPNIKLKKLSFDIREGVIKYRHQAGSIVYMLHEGLAIRTKHKSTKEHHTNSHFVLLFIQLTLCHVVKRSPFSTYYSAVYVLLLVLSDQRYFSGKSFILILRVPFLLQFLENCNFSVDKLY